MTGLGAAGHCAQVGGNVFEGKDLPSWCEHHVVDEQSKVVDELFCVAFSGNHDQQGLSNRVEQPGDCESTAAGTYGPRRCEIGKRL